MLVDAIPARVHMQGTTQVMGPVANLMFACFARLQQGELLKRFVYICDFMHFMHAMPGFQDAAWSVIILSVPYDILTVVYASVLGCKRGIKPSVLHVPRQFLDCCLFNMHGKLLRQSCFAMPVDQGLS